MQTAKNSESLGRRTPAPNGSAAKMNEAQDDADLEKEEVEDVEEEVPLAAKKEEAPKEDFAKLKAEYEAVKQAKEAAEARAKDLGARLTKEQQVRAEWERYHTQTLPKINKTFEERWNESPETAVKTEIDHTVTPVSQELARTRAETWMTQIMVSDPDMAKYEQRVIELSLESPEFAQLTYSKSGIKRLFMIAEAEEVKKERNELREKINVSREKSRAFTEEGSSRVPGAQRQAKLTPAQLEVARKMGIKPEDYLKRIDQVRTIGEADFDV